MREIIIDKVFWVDDDVYEYIRQFKYKLRRHRRTYYAKRNVCIGDVKKEVQMSSDVWCFHYGVEFAVLDHKNGNGWDNRLENLRLATSTENSRNKRKANGSYKSTFKGVSKNRYEFWCAYIRAGELQKDGRCKHINLGFFNTEKEAAHAYDLAAIKYFGEFAKLNFDKDTYTGQDLESYLEQHKRKRSKTSRSIGVSWNKKDKRWMVFYKHTYIGSFLVEEDAVKAYLEYQK